MSYPDAAWERAMTVQEVMLKALSGELHWFRAADILGWSPRTLRRWRERYEQHGYVGLVDKRLHRPSRRRVAAPEVERLLRLYRERYGLQCPPLSSDRAAGAWRHGVVQLSETDAASGGVGEEAAGARAPSPAA